MAILFPLELRGFGTHDVESLGSYIHRLSFNHDVTANYLLNISFSWYLDKFSNNVKDHVFRSCGDLSHYSRPNTLTLEIVKVFEYLTGEKNLRSATFLAVYKALDRSSGQYAKNFRWCPCCMNEFEKANDPGYFKLIWSILDVTHCHEHKVELIDRCQKCSSYQKGFGYKKTCSVCQKCGVSLGQFTSKVNIIPSWKLKGLDIIEFVDKIARDSELSFPENGIKNLLSKIFDEVWAKDEENSLWSIIPRDEYLGLTCGNTTVSLQIARRFAVRLGIDLSDLLMGESDRLPSLLDSAWFKKLPREFIPKKKKTKHNRKEIYKKLMGICSNTNKLPASFSGIANHLGVSKGYLEYHFPEISKRIINLNREFRRKNQLRKKHEARVEALKYFIGKDTYSNFSRKDALKKIRKRTGLPKNILFEEINFVYKILF